MIFSKLALIFFQDSTPLRGNSLKAESALRICTHSCIVFFSLHVENGWFFRLYVYNETISLWVYWLSLKMTETSNPICAIFNSINLYQKTFSFISDSALMFIFYVSYMQLIIIKYLDIMRLGPSNLGPLEARNLEWPRQGWSRKYQGCCNFDLLIPPFLHTTPHLDI